MIPARFAPVVFGFILSGLMSFLVSGISLYLAGQGEGMKMSVWVAAWLPSWAISFPTVLVVGPLTRRIVALMVRAD